MSAFIPDHSGLRCALCLEDFLPLQRIRISDTGRATLCSFCFQLYCKYGHGRYAHPTYDAPLRNTVLALHRKKSALGYLRKETPRIRHIGNLIETIRRKKLPLQSLLLHPLP